MASEKNTILPPPRARAAKSQWKKVGKLILYASGVAVGLRGAFHVLNTLTAGEDRTSSAAKCVQVDPLTPNISSDSLQNMDAYLDSAEFRDRAVELMAGAVRVSTQSFDDMGAIGEDPRWDVFFDFAAYLEKTFPLVHENLKLEKVNTHGLLYTWQGTDAAKKPTVFMAHQDVVPVAESTKEQWTHPPFSGFFDGESVWGRGSVDCKNNLIGILESVEQLLKAGFVPTRTLVLSFGFDEEISGFNGAAYLTEALIDRYGKDGAAIIVDEGAGSSKTWGARFAQPGVAEKGYIDAEIIVRMPGGHSSIPPAHTGIGVASELISLIEAHPYEPHFHSDNPFLSLLQCGNAWSDEFPSNLKKHLPWKERTCHAKKDKLALEAAKLGDLYKYLFTTSVATDVISGGVKNNALPERTRILVNHRVNVGDSTEEVKMKITRLAEQIASKYNLTVHAFDDAHETPRSITLNAVHTLEPAPVTPTSVDGVTPYGVLSGTTRALYGEDVIMAPGIMTGNTDTRFYWDLSKHIFRYGPGWAPGDEQLLPDGIHTVDEHLNIVAHIKGTQWYSLFIRNMDEAEIP
ncbi:peptidase family M20/M25/M40 [Xylariaceae sp. FL0255]|nr:peptidase family M20/M25/M40 [Xylariaceae sp. FL0255]